MSLGIKIARLRNDRGESVLAVAGAVGASRAHIWEVETGRSANPSLDLLRRLADHFNVTVGWLIDETPDAEADPTGVALYRSVRALSPQNRRHVAAIIQSMKKAEE